MVAKPCFMMSPLSVAQYLEPGRFQFDIVIMDEASQILPENAIGAIMRSAPEGSVVIVGDPKQLPPTNFFREAAQDDNDGNDGTSMQQMASILDAFLFIADCSNGDFRKRQLRWHYRSRHESLIAFSSKYFYGSKLVIFPLPWHYSKDLGIRYERVDGYLVDRRNTIEAQAIARRAAEILKSGSGESLGIVAMNVQQQDEIIMCFDELQKEDPELKDICNVWEKTAPVFIKNLENVQGDERDVILISMTYGPDKDTNKVAQRFGPINKADGWRRLNVLFTRARKRMHVFSSMNSGDVLAKSEDKRGVHALRDFLQYCEQGHLHQPTITGRLPDNDFEIAVMQALQKHGYECAPQVGVNGFFIDVAVKYPGRPEQFMMGIECDGATYHSSKSVRDRDRLRQKILENLGREIQRIWSADWFKNPETALKPILERLDELKAKDAQADLFVRQSI